MRKISLLFLLVFVSCVPQKNDLDSTSSLHSSSAESSLQEESLTASLKGSSYQLSEEDIDYLNEEGMVDKEESKELKSIN